MRNKTKCSDLNVPVLAMMLLGVWAHAGAQTPVSVQNPQAKDCAALTTIHLEKCLDTQR